MNRLYKLRKLAASLILPAIVAGMGAAYKSREYFNDLSSKTVSNLEQVVSTRNAEAQSVGTPVVYKANDCNAQPVKTQELDVLGSSPIDASTVKLKNVIFTEPLLIRRMSNGGNLTVKNLNDSSEPRDIMNSGSIQPHVGIDSSQPYGIDKTVGIVTNNGVFITSFPNGANQLISDTARGAYGQRMPDQSLIDFLGGATLGKIFALNGPSGTYGFVYSLDGRPITAANIRGKLMSGQEINAASCVSGLESRIMQSNPNFRGISNVSVLDIGAGAKIYIFGYDNPVNAFSVDLTHYQDFTNTDSSKRKIPNVLVHLLEDNNKSCTTGFDGRCAIPGIQNGAYTVLMEGGGIIPEAKRMNINSIQNLVWYVAPEQEFPKEFFETYVLGVRNVLAKWNNPQDITVGIQTRPTQFHLWIDRQITPEEMRTKNIPMVFFYAPALMKHVYNYDISNDKIRDVGATPSVAIGNINWTWTDSLPESFYTGRANSVSSDGFTINRGRVFLRTTMRDPSSRYAFYNLHSFHTAIVKEFTGTLIEYDDPQDPNIYMRFDSVMAANGGSGLKEFPELERIGRELDAAGYTHPNPAEAIAPAIPQTDKQTWAYVLTKKAGLRKETFNGRQYYYSPN